MAEAKAKNPFEGRGPAEEPVEEPETAEDVTEAPEEDVAPPKTPPKPGAGKPPKPGAGNAGFGTPGGAGILKPDMEIDLDGVESSNSKTITPGEHFIVCTAVGQATSKDKGNPMLVYDFRVLSGDDTGKTGKMWVVLTPDALWKVSEVVEAFGMKLAKPNKPTVGELQKLAEGVVVVGGFGKDKNNPRFTNLNYIRDASDMGFPAGTKLADLTRA